MKPSERGHVFLDIIITVVLLSISVPALAQLYTLMMIRSTTLELQSRALYLCEEKIEQIAMDKTSPSRGYAYVTTVGRYPSESVQGFTRTVAVTTGLTFNSVSYASVSVTVSRSGIQPVSLTTWITRY